MVFEQRPSRHVDVGSRIDGFVAHVLPFMLVTVVDIRPLARDTVGVGSVVGYLLPATQFCFFVQLAQPGKPGGLHWH